MYHPQLSLSWRWSPTEVKTGIMHRFAIFLPNLINSDSIRNTFFITNKVAQIYNKKTWPNLNYCKSYAWDFTRIIPTVAMAFDPHSLLLIIPPFQKGTSYQKSISLNFNLTLVLIRRDGDLSTLCYNCRFACQQRVQKRFLALAISTPRMG